MSGILNPLGYAQWSNCGVGSTVTTENISEMTRDVASFRTVVHTRHTLVALDADKATVEIEVHDLHQSLEQVLDRLRPLGVLDSEEFEEIKRGLETKNTVEIPAHPEAEPEERRIGGGGDDTEGYEVTARSFDAIFKGETPKETDETLDVAGRSLACRRIDRSVMLHGAPFTITFWMSDQVPGGLVRMESRMGSGEVTKISVIAFEKK